jgi:hypothetical protein
LGDVAFANIALFSPIQFQNWLCGRFLRRLVNYDRFLVVRKPIQNAPNKIHSPRSQNTASQFSEGWDREKPGAERAATGDLGPCSCQMHPPKSFSIGTPQEPRPWLVILCKPSRRNAGLGFLPFGHECAEHPQYEQPNEICQLVMDGARRERRQHFKPCGKRRLHKKPSPREVARGKQRPTFVE